MTAPTSPPSTPTPPALPAQLAATTPAVLIKLVALALAAIGVMLSWWNPLHLTDDTAKAVIMLGFLVVAATIFTVHTVLAAVHEYGFSTRALDKVEADELAGLKQLWPELSATWAAAKPGLDALPAVQSRLDTVSGDVASVKAKVDAIPPEQLAAVAAAFHALTASTTEPTITVTPASPPPAPAGPTN